MGQYASQEAVIVAPASPTSRCRMAMKAMNAKTPNCASRRNV